MGITGLLGLLKPVIRRRRIDEYSGKRLGIDGHVWLHQILPSIAYEVYNNEKTDRHIGLFMKKVFDLVDKNIRLVLVFDGDSYESKGETNKKRAELRKSFADQVEVLLKKNETEKAREYMKKSIGVSQPVLCSVLEELQRHNIEYIISPYESDAQLSFLQKSGCIDYIMSEDSDIIPYGGSKILYKYNGHSVDEFDAETLSDFRNGAVKRHLLDMCILSGCDYLASIKGIGINTAYKYLQKYGSVKKLLDEIKLIKNVPQNYADSYKNAKLSFLHHMVYNPLTSRRQYLNASPVSYEFLGTLEDLPLCIKNFDGLEISYKRHFAPSSMSIEVLSTASAQESTLITIPK